MMRDYEVVNDEWIKLNDGPYAGIVYRYGRVQFVEEGEFLRIKFVYELQDGTTKDQEFADYIGPILVELIDQGLMKNSIVYTGGV